jgi:hypothetical protein
VGGEVFERDGLVVCGDEGVLWRVTLERVVELDYLLLDQLCEQVSGEDFGERTEANDGIGCWDDVRIGGDFAIAVEEDLIIADYDYDHADRA